MSAVSLADTSLERAALEELARRTLKRQSQDREKRQQGADSLAIILPSLHAAQDEIKAHDARFKVVNCGRRFGKDILCVDLAIWPVLDGYPVGWFQPSYRSLLEVWRLMKRVLRPITVSTSEQDKRIEITTGGIIEFWSLDGDPEACRGRKYKRVVVNEAAKARYLQQAWEMAIRATLADYRGDAIFPSTPRGRDYYWQLYQRGLVGSETYDPRWKSWQKPTSDNPHIDPEEIKDAEHDLPTDVFAQEFLAAFLDVAGRFFDDWEPDREFTDLDPYTEKYITRREQWHVVDPKRIPDHWDYWGGCDYGTTPTQKTFAFVLLTKGESGCTYVVDEVYEAGLEAPEQADAILACLQRNGIATAPESGIKWNVSARYKGTQLDPGFGYTRTFPPRAVGPEGHLRRQGKFPAEYYWERGLKARPASTDKVAGWREVKTVMHGCIVVKEKGGGETEMPMLRVFRQRCANLIRTLPILVRSDVDPEVIAGDNVQGGERKQEDHLCFVAGTLVETASGPKPIEAITTDDRVLTRFGFRAVTDCGLTRMSDTVRVLFSDGRTIQCTPDHPVFVKGKGFVRTCELRYDDIILDSSEVLSCRGQKVVGSTNRKPSFSTKFDFADILTALAGRIVCTPARLRPRLSAALKPFIARYGSRRTARFQMGSISIISTATLRTTTFPICRAWMSSATIPGICVNRLIAANASENSRSQPTGKALSIGDQKRVGVGCAIVRRKLDSVSGTAYRDRASSAARSSWRLRMEAISSAGRTAVRKTDAIAGLTMLPGIASIATRFSWLIRTARKERGDSAGIHVLRSHGAGRKDVYNLTVDGCPEYFANGVLVHNCWALKAGLMVRKNPAGGAPPPEGNREPRSLRNDELPEALRDEEPTTRNVWGGL